MPYLFKEDCGGKLPRIERLSGDKPGDEAAP
jgi:hypothetical protein